MSTAALGIIISIALYMIGMLVIGFWTTKRNKTSDDFYLGGRRLGPLVTAMPTVAPKDTFMIAVKPTSLFTKYTYSIRIFDQKNAVVYTGNTLHINDLQEMAPAAYYLAIDVELTRGDEYKHLAFFAIIDMAPNEVVG